MPLPERVLASIPQGKPEDLLCPDVTPEAVSMAFRHVCKLLGAPLSDHARLAMCSCSRPMTFHQKVIPTGNNATTVQKVRRSFFVSRPASVL